MGLFGIYFKPALSVSGGIPAHGDFLYDPACQQSPFHLFGDGEHPRCMSGSDPLLGPNNHGIFLGQIFREEDHLRHTPIFGESARVAHTRPLAAPGETGLPPHPFEPMPHDRIPLCPRAPQPPCPMRAGHRRKEAMPSREVRASQNYARGALKSIPRGCCFLSTPD